MSLPATNSSLERTLSAKSEHFILQLTTEQNPLTPVAWFAALFTAAEASPVVSCCRRHGRGSSSSFLITPHRTKSCYDSGFMCTLVLNASSSPSSLCCWIALMIRCTPLSLFLTSLTFLPIIKQRTEPVHSVFSLKVKHAPSSPPTLHIFRIRGQKDAVCRIGIVVAPLGLDSCVYCTSYPASFSTANIAQIYHVSCLNSRQLLIRPLDSRHCFGNKRIQSAPDAGRNLSNSHVHHFVLTFNLLAWLQP